MTAATETQPKTPCSQPIPPPHQPQQYRAIGLLWGKYTPNEELTKGTLLTADDVAVDAVIKGNILSLVKNKLDLAEPHLWVVYPRTPPEDSLIPLHVQIAGVWEPQTLHPDLEVTELQYQADDFSVQGEVVFQDLQSGKIVVKIIRRTQKEEEVPKYFKVTLKGFLPPKSIKHFWEFTVRRIGADLVIQQAENIASLAPFNKSGGGGKRPFNKGNNRYRDDKGAPPRKPMSKDSPPPSKPIIKKAKPQTD
ncbi:MAG: hypothetical protein HC907_33770 [Richelia sp. SM1_7_0]|nr:hypothetical protein [Richelia sp. SM1_7_0]